MKRLYTLTNINNQFLIISQGLSNGLADITGNPNDFETYALYVTAGYLGNRKVFDFVKQGGVITNISQSPYIGIVENTPVWKEGIEIQLLSQLNEQIRQQRSQRYTQEVDPFTLEYSRKDISAEIDELTKQELKVIIKDNQTKIKTELPYYTEVILL